MIRQNPKHRACLLAATSLACLSNVCDVYAQEPGADTGFDRHDIGVGPLQRVTVLSGSVTGDAMSELIFIGSDEHGARRIRVLQFDGTTWKQVAGSAMRSGVAFVDVVNVGGRDRLICYEQGRISWFDPDTSTLQPLLEIPANFRKTDDGAIPHVDISMDLNLDGRDDLVAPAVDGFWISTQNPDGTFSDAEKLGPAEPYAGTTIGNLDVDEPNTDQSRTYGDIGVTASTIPWYLSRVFRADFDGDGRSDLVFWNQGQFDVHRQNQHGGFDPDPVAFTTRVPIDEAGTYTRAFDYRDDGVVSTLLGSGKKTRRTVLHSLRDVNGDNVADLVTVTFTGRSIARQRSRFEFHLGMLTPNGIDFAEDAATAIVPRGKAGAMQPWGYAYQLFDDFNGDDREDVMFRTVPVGLGGMTRALAGKSVPIDLEFYRFEADGYPDKPAMTRKIRRFAPFRGEGDIFFPVVMVGDVNGDGHADLLVGTSPTELSIFRGTDAPDLFERQARKLEIDLPYDERHTRLSDLNGDGAMDILVHHRSTTGPDRIELRISRTR
jgi:hypothetical protein